MATRCVTFCSNSQRLAGPILLKGSTSARFTKPRATNLRQARMEGPGDKWGGREAGLCYVSHMETHQAVQFACKSVKQNCTSGAVHLKELMDPLSPTLGQPEIPLTKLEWPQPQMLGKSCNGPIRHPSFDSPNIQYL